MLKAMCIDSLFETKYKQKEEGGAIARGSSITVGRCFKLFSNKNN
jgi:hypothetical protein